MDAAGPMMSVEEYLKYSEKPNCEYVDGVLRPKPKATSLHGLIQLLLAMLLRRQGADARTEVTVRLTPTKYLVPDVIAHTHIEDPYPTEPVMLCVEILSPEDRLGAVLAKCEEYHDWGVPHCWIVDPVKQTAWEYHRGNDPLRIEVGSTLRAGSLSVQLTELFSQVQ
jgi:Uma2 family endonuclease